MTSREVVTSSNSLVDVMDEVFDDFTVQMMFGTDWFYRVTTGRNGGWSGPCGR
jgi:hypothetical protein